jgi:hypothetical protein
MRVGMAVRDPASRVTGTTRRRYGVTVPSSFARCATVNPPTRRFSSTPLPVGLRGVLGGPCNPRRSC